MTGGDGPRGRAPSAATPACADTLFVTPPQPPPFAAELEAGHRLDQDAALILQALGSGGGLDVFLAARKVGPTGKAIGIDMTPEMLELARRNQAEAGAENVEFLLGTIEDIPLPDDSVDVTSPFVGTFYRSPSPDSPTFVEVGSVVRPGQTLCIIEAMKILNEIEADKSGTVSKILCENGQAVEYGQPLFIIE